MFGVRLLMSRRDRAARRRWPLVLSIVVSLLMLLRPGLAPASVEEQRKRLPPPARDCDDPITGYWMGHQLLNDYWYRFTLDIDRLEPGGEELVGKIESHYWNNLESKYEPPSCEEKRHNQVVIDMNAGGRFEKNAVAFLGKDWTLKEELCGRFSGAYYPDGFSGELIHEGTEFHSINDDGHNAITTVVFRRIRCKDIDRPLPELPGQTPPPNYSSGCGGCF